MRSILAIVSIVFLETVVGEGNYFYCMDGNPIPQEEVCDGVAQCDDESDEDEDICSTGKDEFECYDGQFITSKALCNGTAECSDESDESVDKCIFKRCGENTFRCNYGACIDNIFVCDKKYDCMDGSDEEEEICSEDNKCTIPEQSPHSKMQISDCANCTPGTSVRSGTKINVSCHRGYTLYSKYGEATCENGKWTPEIATCYRQKTKLISPTELPKGFCAPILEETGAFVLCTKGRRKLKCQFPLPRGTTAKFSCHDYYTSGGNNKTKCLPDGKWSEKVKCASSCFKGAGVALIVKGQVAQSQKFFPWVAALYAIENKQWTYRCGGTLISDRAIITAAHCVWKMSASDLKVTLGKKYRDYYETEVDQQNFDIESVKTLSVYQDSTGNYGSDMAILIFRRSAQLSDDINPACVHWDEDFSDKFIMPGRKGIVAGWGFTENDKPSDVLRYTIIPIINSSECISKQPGDFRKFITYTSFCAGYDNGTSVCNGDSGSGLLIHDNGALYLEGIVSVSPRKTNSFSCDPTLYTVFTKVNAYKRWIKKILDEII